MWKKLAAAAVVTSALASPAGATLVEIDGWALDDGLLTRDTDTGLDWLDLTESLGRSPRDMRRSDFGGLADDGFRFATRDETLDLFANAGFTVTNPNPLDTRGVGATDGFIDLIGCTARCDDDPFAFGYVFQPVSDAFLVSIFPPHWRVRDFHVDKPDKNVGVFLVRSTPAQDALIAGPRISFEGINLPEPGAFALLGLGLLGLAARRFV